MKYTPRLPERNDNVTPRSPLGQFFILAGGLLGIVVVTYFILGLLVDVIVPHISPDLEKKLAGVFMTAVEDGSNSDTGPQTRLCQRLIDKLQQDCDNSSAPHFHRQFPQGRYHTGNRKDLAHKPEMQAAARIR